MKCFNVKENGNFKYKVKLSGIRVDVSQPTYTEVEGFGNTPDESLNDLMNQDGYWFTYRDSKKEYFIGNKKVSKEEFV